MEDDYHTSEKQHRFVFMSSVWSGCTHQFVEMSAVDLNHFSFIAQTGDVVLKVQLNAGLRRRRDGQSDGITIHQPVLNLRRLHTFNFNTK